ncbi:hypothetical protein N2W54_006964 [Lotmaria passim]
MTQASEFAKGEERLPRRAPAFHPVLMEVAGCMEDESVREVTQRLRKYRNRYMPLLRCMFTLVAASVPEARLFGDDDPSTRRSVTAAAAAAGATAGDVDGVGKSGAKAGQNATPLFAAPRYAISVDKTYPLLRRLYTPSVDVVGDAVVSSPVSSAENPLGESETFTSSLLLLPWVDAGPQRGFSSTAAATTATTVSACRERAVCQLEDFMNYHFLPFAMTHNTPSPFAAADNTPFPSPFPVVLSAERTFVLRHYVNEACRTSSFLFADPYHSPCGAAHGGAHASLRQAVLVDPHEEQLEAYLADMAVLDAALTCVIFTHCYVDGSAGLPALIARYPDVRVVSGLPLAPAGTTCVIPVSSYLSLRTVAIPAFSPECLLVEVHAGASLVGLCTGVLWSTDAAPRWDLLQWSPFPSSALTVSSSSSSMRPGGPTAGAASSGAEENEPCASAYGGGDRDAALAHTHRVLKEFFFDPYLAPLCRNAARHGPPTKSARVEGDTAYSADARNEEKSAERAADELQRVVLLPTHGGYNNVTNQLDLYWAAHLGDLCRMKHSRTVIDTVAASADVFVKYNKRIPRLPHPPLFDACRVTHLRQLLECMTEDKRARCVAQLPADMQRALTASSHPLARRIFVNVVDVRNAEDYHALHLSGSVNVPMSFPGVAYGARRAELWLQCVLVPHQPILALCAAASQKAEVHRRLTALSPGCTVTVCTLDDLPHSSIDVHLQQPRGRCAVADNATTTTVPSASVAVSAGVEEQSSLPWLEVHCERPAALPAETPIPRELVWVQHAVALVRLTSYEHLVAIEPTDTRVVLDVRTPYEFKNGSHQHSVHVELSEMCALAVEDAMQTSLSPTTSNSDSTSVPWYTGSSPRLADVYMERLHTNALMAGLPIVRQETALSDIVIYCAGGYRSLIAASLMQRAIETSRNPAWRALHITDVSGGAFQIMTQRPDLWRVKDRSIICIS